MKKGYFESAKDLIAQMNITGDKYAKSHKVLFSKNYMSPTQDLNMRDKMFAEMLDKYRKNDKALLKLETNNSNQKLEYSRNEKQLNKLENCKQVQAVLFNQILRGYSLMDLNEEIYNRINLNPDSMGYWLYPLKDSIKNQHFFKLPDTSILQLPIEIAQYLRHDYMTETNSESRKALNEVLFKAFKLDENKEYFIKTGLFSSKFEFQNAHIDDPKSIGDYFHVINNIAMTVGAALTNELVVREWIPDPDNRPTIYDGMPLRTEFRAFIDCDLKKIIDVVPYWNNQKVLDNLNDTVKHFMNNKMFTHDQKAYKQAWPILNEDFNKNKDAVSANLSRIVEDLDLHGCWSLDVMKSGSDFYLIDMAALRHSALVDTVNKEKLAYDLILREKNNLPAAVPEEYTWITGTYSNISKVYFSNVEISD